MPVISVKLGVGGMHCSGCEDTIERAVSGLPGIQSVSASYADSQVLVSFDDLQSDEATILAAISAAGYTTTETPAIKRSSLPAWLIFAALLIVVGSIVFWGRSQMPDVMQQLDAQMSYALLFTIGVLTGFHCIGMCGSFVVNYARDCKTRAQAIQSHVAYGSGKTLSYVLIGAGFGLLLGCGPLQAMYIMAAGTGDPVQGAILLFFFGIGTLPPLLGYGFFANLLSARAVSEMVRVSGILVIAMGMMMAQRGIGFLNM
jgi:copper chaperone CopZ